MKVRALHPARMENAPDRLMRLDYGSSYDKLEEWALLLPAAPGKTWVVMIHGHGAGGDQLYARSDIKEVWLSKFMASGCGVLTPHLRGNSWMSSAAAEDLHELIRYVRREYFVRHFILASGSMGGTSNLTYAVLHPEDIGGVVALCPATDLAIYQAWCRTQDSGVVREIADAIERAYGGRPDQRAEVYRRHSALVHFDRLTMPVYMAHGAADTIIPVNQSRQLAAKVRESDLFCYQEIPDGGHDAPIPVMTTALDWVMARLDRTVGSPVRGDKDGSCV